MAPRDGIRIGTSLGVKTVTRTVCGMWTSQVMGRDRDAMLGTLDDATDAAYAEEVKDSDT